MCDSYSEVDVFFSNVRFYELYSFTAVSLGMYFKYCCFDFQVRLFFQVFKRFANEEFVVKGSGSTYCSSTYIWVFISK